MSSNFFKAGKSEETRDDDSSVSEFSLFLDNFKEGLLLAGEASIGKVAAALLLEGMAGSVVVSFATMQYWKDVRRSTRSIDLHKA